MLVTSAPDNSVALEATVMSGVQEELSMNSLMGVVLSMVVLPSLIIQGRPEMILRLGSGSNRWNQSTAFPSSRLNVRCLS